MIDNVLSHALIGNKSHKSKLETVRLQIVALRAVEAQLEDWILEEHRANEERAEKDVINLTNEQVSRITKLMEEGGLIRSSVQSSEWAGLAVIKAMCKPDDPAVDQRDYAKKVIDFMLSIGAIEKSSAFNTTRGRDLPIYSICNLTHLALLGEENLRKPEER